MCSPPNRNLRWSRKRVVSLTTFPHRRQNHAAQYSQHSIHQLSRGSYRPDRRGTVCRYSLLFAQSASMAQTPDATSARQVLEPLQSLPHRQLSNVCRTIRTPVHSPAEPKQNDHKSDFLLTAAGCGNTVCVTGSQLADSHSYVCLSPPWNF